MGDVYSLSTSTLDIFLHGRLPPATSFTSSFSDSHSRDDMTSQSDLTSIHATADSIAGQVFELSEMVEERIEEHRDECRRTLSDSHCRDCMTAQSYLSSIDAAARSIAVQLFELSGKVERTIEDNRDECRRTLFLGLCHRFCQLSEHSTGDAKQIGEEVRSIQTHADAMRTEGGRIQIFEQLVDIAERVRGLHLCPIDEFMLACTAEELWTIVGAREVTLGEYVNGSVPSDHALIGQPLLSGRPGLRPGAPTKQRRPRPKRRHAAKLSPGTGEGPSDSCSPHGRGTPLHFVRGASIGRFPPVTRMFFEGWPIRFHVHTPLSAVRMACQLILSKSYGCCCASIIASARPLHIVHLSSITSGCPYTGTALTGWYIY
jgi:hypothetical protein